MTQKERSSPVIRFDAFEADLRSGELRKHGLRLKIGDQPFSVLAVLLAQPGEVVTREDLQKKLWPADTFVDFDRGLNKAINRLRETLGDSADSPRFIETLPKRGYRFIGTLTASAPLPQTTPIQPDVIPRQRDRRSARARGYALGAAALTICVMATAWLLMRNRPEQRAIGPLIRSSLLPPPHMSFVPYSLALSPNGGYLAFVAEGKDGSRSLWIRSMSKMTATSIARTEGASFPFWSPDERRIGFFSDRKLKTIDIASGAINVVADARRASGGAWGTSGAIVFAPDVNGPIYQVAEMGGTPSPITRVLSADGLQGHRWPVFLPDGRHFLYVNVIANARSGDHSEISVGSLDSTEPTRIASENVRTVAFALDHLFFVRTGVLYAQPFDSVRLRATAEPIPVTDRDIAGLSAFYPSEFSISQNGVLAFQSSTDLASILVWIDAKGNELGAFPAPQYADPAFSPDGRFLAGACDLSGTGTLAICVHDIARGVTARVSPGPHDRFPVWSPDSREIAYNAQGGIYRISADGSGTPTFVSNWGIPTAWSPDGRILAFGSNKGVLSLALWSLSTHDPLELGPGAEAQLSPDANWMAFLSQDGLAVQRFPKPTKRVQIAGYGATQPRWSRNGHHLFYITSDKKLMAVDFDSATARVSAPRLVSQTRIIASSFTGFQYDVAPDGRFLVNTLTSEAAPLTLMTGWTERLRRR
jgi:DNA-binding winged helix-turn-helix (wHTH) protein/Tol biopolymer transport system component